jgi:hypothetical protein
VQESNLRVPRASDVCEVHLLFGASLPEMPDAKDIGLKEPSPGGLKLGPEG